MSSETPSLSSERDPKLYLRDTVEFLRPRCRVYVRFRCAGFAGRPMRYDATLRNLELIGEAATRVPAELRERASEVSWRLVIGTRNRLAHGYLGIEPETVWLIATGSVPRLRLQLLALLAAT